MTAHSGIYATFGTVRKDLITEATAQDFRDWMALQGFNISFMSDSTLNGYFLGGYEPILQWQIRLAFIKDAEAQGVTIYPDKKEWEAFLNLYKEEARRHYG